MTGPGRRGWRPVRGSASNEWADYHLRVVCRDKDDYNVFLEPFLFRLPGIAHVRTNLVLKDIKLHRTIPT